MLIRLQGSRHDTGLCVDQTPPRLALTSPYAYFEAPSSTHCWISWLPACTQKLGSIGNLVFLPAQALDRLKVEQRGSLVAEGAALGCAQMGWPEAQCPVLVSRYNPQR